MLFETVFNCSGDNPHHPPPTLLGSYFHVTRNVLQVCGYMLDMYIMLHVVYNI